MSPAPPTNLPEAIASIITNAELGVLGDDMLIGFLLPEPDALLVISEYDGQPPIETFELPLPAVDIPRIQVYARGAREDYHGTRTRLMNVRAALCGVVTTTVFGVSPAQTTILRVAPLGQINTMGRDLTDRPEFTANFECWVLPTGE